MTDATPTPDPPHVTAPRRSPNPSFPGYWLTFIDCPFCGREHIHGDSAGHRVAHCSGPGTAGGYVIDHPAEWEDHSS